jgi:hypothetical protein
LVLSVDTGINREGIPLSGSNFAGIFDVKIRINLMDMYTGFLPYRGYAIDSDDWDEMLTRVVQRPRFDEDMVYVVDSDA